MTQAAPKQIHSLCIGESDCGRRLDVVISERIESLSRARVQALMKSGMVMCEGRPAKAAQRAGYGQQLVVEIPQATPAVPVGQDLPLQVLHEDSEIVVVDKAAGMVVHPAPGNSDGTLVNALIGRYGAGFVVGGQLRPGIVHRLDKGTSGVMVVARNDAALQHLQRQFQQRLVKKHYLAVVNGRPPAQGELDTPYGRHPRLRQRYTSRCRESKRRALLSYQTVSTYGQACLLQIRLKTGRTHQIRVQMADLGHPLLGDETYGGRRMAQLFERPALHSHSLEIEHPGTGLAIQFKAELPEDMQRLCARLRQGG